MGTTARARGRRRSGASIRSRALHALAAACAVAVVAPLMAAGPAQARLSGLEPLTPVIEAGEGGKILLEDPLKLLPTTVVCESDGTVTEICDPVTLSGLTGTLLRLTAVPTDPSAVPNWGSTCPSALGPVCEIPVALLDGFDGTPLAPAVQFLRPDAGQPSEGPKATITSKEQKTYSGGTRTFTFKAEPMTDTTVFECQLSHTAKGTPAAGSERGHERRRCGTRHGAAYAETYGKLADGTYSFTVWAVETADGTPVEGTPATETWTQSNPPESPETRITGGPRNNAWVLANRVTYRFASTVEGSRFDCTYNKVPQDNLCDSGTFGVRRPAKGTHHFTVQSVANGTRDYSPVERRFHVPIDDRALVGEGWAAKEAKGHFKGTFRESWARGATLQTKAPQQFHHVVLVADKGRGHGTVRVFWGKKMLKEVSLHAKQNLKARVIPIKSFQGEPRKGRLRVVVATQGQVVRIDGLGVAAR